MRLPLDHHLSRRVTGVETPFAHPHLVINVANGQTTYPSQHVKGNLFYRGLILRRPVFLGDSINTVTKVVGLKQNRPKPGRAATGMVALEMETRNQNDELVLQYWRCPMIPCRDPDAVTGKNDDFSWIGEDFAIESLFESLPDNWKLDALVSDVTGLSPPTLEVGTRLRLAVGDTISSAPELVRVTLNQAYTHSDARRSHLGQRLVYGGHTISLVLAQVSRMIPNIVTVVAWRGCDHTGPVLEGDLIESRLEVSSVTPTPKGGQLMELHVNADAIRGKGDESTTNPILDWRLIVWTV